MGNEVHEPKGIVRAKKFNPCDARSILLTTQSRMDLMYPDDLE